MVAANPSESRETGRYGAQEQPRRRALLFAVVLHLLVGLLFAVQKREPITKMGEEGLKTFNVAPEGPKGSETQKTEQKQEKKEKTKQAASQVQPVVAETPPPQAPPPPVVRDFQMPFLQLSSQDYASSNIGKQASLRPPAGPALAQAGGNGPSGPGSGPGGATLYPADWYREPTDAELGGYLKPDMPRQGSGTIACRTVAQHHVEDCYILGESPRGSGFARSVLNAAWQFLVLPPRINGKEQVGAWVSIRITYYDGSVKTGGGN
jgi:protein TonB